MNEIEPLHEVNPEVSLFSGPIHFGRSLKRDWYLIRNLVRKDLRARYSRTIIGYGWTFLEPFLLSAVYYVLFSILAGRPDPLYPLHVLVGVIVWGHFGKTLQATVACLTKSGNLMKQVYFPREILALSPMFSQLWITSISLLAVIPVMWYLGVTPNSSIWMIPVGILLATMIAFGVGLLVAPLNAISQDITHLFRFIVRAGFFVSPVMWTYEMMLERAGGGWIDLVMANPMVVPLTYVRHGLDGTELNLAANHITYSFAFATISLILGMMVFKRWEARVVKYI
jgi:ABC-2 type transport system permease protein